VNVTTKAGTNTLVFQRVPHVAKWFNYELNRPDPGDIQRSDVGRSDWRQATRTKDDLHFVRFACYRPIPSISNSRIRILYTSVPA